MRVRPFHLEGQPGLRIGELRSETDVDVFKVRWLLAFQGRQQRVVRGEVYFSQTIVWKPLRIAADFVGIPSFVAVVGMIRDRSLELTSCRLFAYLIRLISSRPSLQNELSSAAGSGQGCHRCSAAANTIQKSPPAVALHSAFVQYGFFRRTFVVHFSSDMPCLISDPWRRASLQLAFLLSDGFGFRPFR